MIGLSYIRCSHLQHKLLPLLVQRIYAIVSQSKAKRYEFLFENYPNEQTQKGLMRHTWQEDYVEAIVANYVVSKQNDPFYTQPNPSTSPSAWRWFAPPDTDKNEKIQICNNKQREFVRSNWQFLIFFICSTLANYSRNGIYWSKVAGFQRIEQLLVQSIIWTPLDDPDCAQILQFISSLMRIHEMAHCIGTFGKALIRTTNSMHPQQVQICFDALSEWILHSECRLLPDSFCFDSFYFAAEAILSQHDWQIICVFLCFLLHFSRLFNEAFRSKLFCELLIKKYFRKLWCHWNRLVRKYYFMLLLYSINRCGYFDEERRKKCLNDVKMEQDVIDNAHRCHILVDSMTHLMTKDFDNLTVINESDAELNPEHLEVVECDMSVVEKIENDCHLI